MDYKRVHFAEVVETYEISNTSVSPSLTSKLNHNVPRSCLKKSTKIHDSCKLLCFNPKNDALPTETERTSSQSLDQYKGISIKNLNILRPMENNIMEQLLVDEKKSENQNSTSSSLVPIPEDFWQNSSYYRRNRRCPYIHQIIQMNMRITKTGDMRKRVFGTLIVVELLKETGHFYAKCFTNANLPVHIVIVPYVLFPNFPPPLLSKWYTTIDYVRCDFYSANPMFLARVSFGQKLQYVGTVSSSIPHRTIVFGELDTSYYCETAQLLAPLRQMYEDRNEILRSSLYGQVTFNRNVLKPFPHDMAFIDGYGWIECKPGLKGVVQDNNDESWLLTEPFVTTKVEIIHLDSKLKYNSKEYFERIGKEFSNVPTDRIRGSSLYPRISKKDNGPARTPQGSVNKKQRQEICEKLFYQIKSRRTETNIFDTEMTFLVEKLVTTASQTGRKLAQLCDIVTSYLRDKNLFDRLKTYEPENLEDLRLILKWTVDYSPGGRQNLDEALYDFVFPLYEDPAEML